MYKIFQIILGSSAGLLPFNSGQISTHNFFQSSIQFEIQKNMNKKPPEKNHRKKCFLAAIMEGFLIFLFLK